MYAPGLEKEGQLFWDRAAFAKRLGFERTGFTRMELYRRISDRLTPKYHEWHLWTERTVESLCQYRWIGLAGCSNSAKTHNVVGFAVNWWLACPEESSVILCSTTAKALRRRGWANVQQAFQYMPEKLGNFVDSKMSWQYTKGDDKHAIIGIAVEEGDTMKVADNIKGHHTKRLMIIIDEATAIPEAIYEASYNLYSYPLEFVMAVIGNPRSKLDQHGRFCEPKVGWNQVTLDDEEWETTPKMDGKAGICIRFDALKSPNIMEGKTVSKHLPKRDAVEAAIASKGSENNPSVWSNMRGFWPPEGITSNVFTESQLSGMGCYEDWKFMGATMTVAGFDPAFSQGGDNATFKPARVGEVMPGVWGIQLLPKIVIPINAQSPDPIAYQLANGVKKIAIERGIHPRNIVMDTTGEGGTLCDIMNREWSNEIVRCEFNGRGSLNTVSHEDMRLCVDVYRNMVCELWFTGREFVNSGQLRGMTHELAKELVGRDYTPEDGSKKRYLEPKKEMKVRLGKSPDEADASMLALYAARIRGCKIQAVGLTTERNGYFEKEVELAQQIATEGLYSAENEAEMLELESY